jgi:acetolactate synthase-1/2/3 large subunit
LVLVIGSALGQLSTNKWSAILIPVGPFIQVDIDPRVIGRAFNVTHGIIADGGAFISSLSDCVISRTPDRGEVRTREEALRQIKSKSAFAELEDYADPSNWSDYASTEDHIEGIEPAALIRIVQDFVKENTMLFIDAGNCVGWGAHYFIIDPPTEYHSSLGMGPMGFGVAGVVGAKLGKKYRGEDITCMALVGDAAFLMHGAEVSTASAYKIGAIWIVLSDNDHRMVTQGMRQYTQGGNFEHLYNLGHPDLVKFAQGLGAHAVLVETQQELRGAMNEAVSGARENIPQVIIARIDPRRIPPYYLKPYAQPTLAAIRRERELLSGFWSESKKAMLR